MAHAQFICHAPQRTRTPPRRLFAALVGLIREWRRRARSRARSRRELATLCDRCLRDIGATRYDVYREVNKPFWQA
jgi:uncharacterized protein YjiS (DUF1127 family)